LDSEKDIKKEAKQLAKENNWDKLHTLLYLRTKYENERSSKATLGTSSKETKITD
jgi:hypothetical protein